MPDHQMANDSETPAISNPFAKAGRGRWHGIIQSGFLLLVVLVFHAWWLGLPSMLNSIYALFFIVIVFFVSIFLVIFFWREVLHRGVSSWGGLALRPVEMFAE